MNQPTREEFEYLAAGQRRLEEEVRKLREQVTEPITIPRIELDPGGIQNRLDNHAEMMKVISSKQDEQSKQLQLIYDQSGRTQTDVAVLKGDVSVLKTDVGTLKTDVSTLKQTVERIESKVDERFQSMEKRFDSIAEIQKLILGRLPERGRGQ